jgi:hypothetical protein
MLGSGWCTHASTARKHASRRVRSLPCLSHHQGRRKRAGRTTKSRIGRGVARSGVICGLRVFGVGDCTSRRETNSRSSTAVCRPTPNLFVRLRARLLLVQSAPVLTPMDAGAAGSSLQACDALELLPTDLWTYALENLDEKRDIVHAAACCRCSRRKREGHGPGACKGRADAACQMRPCMSPPPCGPCPDQVVGPCKGSGARRCSMSLSPMHVPLPDQPAACAGPWCRWRALAPC